MAGDSPYKTFSNLYTSILQDFKEQTNTTMVTLAKRWINEAQENVIMRKKRDYLNKTYHYKLEAEVETAFTVTSGSTTVTKTGTATLPTTSTQEHKFKVEGFSEVYDVSSFTSTTITLASAYAGTTATGVTCHFFQSSILLDTDIRSVHKVYHDRNGGQTLLNKGAEDLRDIIQNDPARQDYAQYWTGFGYDNITVTTGSDKKRIIVYPFPTTTYTIHVDANVYIPTMSETTDEPLIPVQYRQILYWYGIMKLGQFHQDQDMINLGMSNFSEWLNRLDGELMPERDLPQIRYDNTRWVGKGTRNRKILKFDH